jgi:hypothetical protein
MEAIHASRCSPDPTRRHKLHGVWDSSQHPQPGIAYPLKSDTRWSSGGLGRHPNLCQEGSMRTKSSRVTGLHLSKSQSGKVGSHKTRFLAPSKPSRVRAALMNTISGDNVPHYEGRVSSHPWISFLAHTNLILCTPFGDPNFYCTQKNRIIVPIIASGLKHHLAANEDRINQMFSPGKGSHSQGWSRAM